MKTQGHGGRLSQGYRNERHSSQWGKYEGRSKLSQTSNHFQKVSVGSCRQHDRNFKHAELLQDMFAITMREGHKGVEQVVQLEIVQNHNKAHTNMLLCLPIQMSR